MQELDRKYVEEQLRALDEGGSSTKAVSTIHESQQDASKSQPSPASRRGKSSAPRSIPLKNFEPRGVVECPLELRDGALQVQTTAFRTSLSCNVPGERWNAKFSGSSLIRGPMGAATGTMLLSYDVLPSRLQISSQMAVGDRASLMLGSLYHTSTASYGIGMLYHPKAFAKKSSYTLELQSVQKLEKAKMAVKFSIPYHVMKPNTTLSVYNETFQMEVGMVKTRPHVSMSISPKLSKNRTLNISCHWQKTSLKLDTNIVQNFGSSKRRLGMGIRHHSRQGLSFLLTWMRGDVVIKIPIFIMGNSNPMQYFCSCCLAAVSYLVQECLAELWKLDGPGNDEALRRQLSGGRSKARQDAEKETNLMERQAKIRREIEKEKSGLVIVKASYYVPLEDSLDVTTQLQFWTDKSSLELPAVSKQNLLGFCKVGRSSSLSDEDESTPWWKFWEHHSGPRMKSNLNRKVSRTPRLKVQYDFAGSSFEIEIKDEEPLSLPSNMARKLR